MKIEKIASSPPTDSRPAYAFDLVKVKKPDVGGILKKGEFAAIADISGMGKDQYLLETTDGRSERLSRKDFRLATPEEVSKMRSEG